MTWCSAGLLLNDHPKSATGSPPTSWYLVLFAGKGQDPTKSSLEDTPAEGGAKKELVGALHPEAAVH